MGKGFNAPVDRRGFLKNTAAVGAAAAGIALTGADLFARGPKGPGPGGPPPHPEHGGPKLKPTRGDIEILVAAQIAEALAVTTYSNIINAAPFFTRLESDDQGYLLAALQEEMSHYLLEQSVTGKAVAVHGLLLSRQHVRERGGHVEHARHARGRLHRGVPRGRAEFQQRRPPRDGCAHHGHRERPSHARARGRPGRVGDRRRRRSSSSRGPRVSRSRWIRRTTTATNERSAGRRSSRRWRRCSRSPTGRGRQGGLRHVARLHVRAVHAGGSHSARRFSFLRWVGLFLTNACGRIMPSARSRMWPVLRRAGAGSERAGAKRQLRHLR